MAASESQLRANKKYHQKFHKLQVRVTHEEQEILETHIKEMGESVNSFTRRAIFETIERDKAQISSVQPPLPVDE